jgi:hypothetical protein
LALRAADARLTASVPTAYAFHLIEQPMLGFWIAGDRLHRVEQLARRVVTGFLAGTVETAAVAQLQSRVVAEEVRRADRAICTRNLLRLVV